MGLYDKRMADLAAAKIGLSKASVPPKDKADLDTKIKAIEANFKKAVTQARAQKKLNDQANILKKKFDDFVEKFPDPTPLRKLVQSITDAADTTGDASKKLMDDATKKKDAASAKALDKLTTALTAIMRDTESYTIFVGTADD